MKVFLAGATGVLGTRLLPLLVAAGHEVVAMTRTTAGAEALRANGATPAVADGLDRDATSAAVAEAKPDVVVHQMTSLKTSINMRKFDDSFALTNRLRTEGTDNLLAAARAAGVQRFVVQSYGGWTYERTGSPVKTEDDPLDPSPPASMRQTLAAVRHLESAVLSAEGIDGVVLRYGGFYGPGTSVGIGGELVEAARKRMLPVIGDGAGVTSFVHIDDAAQATLLAIESAAPGVYNICDDEPAPASEWVPALAEAAGAKPPWHVPRWLGRLAAGEAGVSAFTRTRGAGNAKARQELGWKPTYPGWREGFRTGL
ncbi:MAG: NAD-dependent epimerase/dehydratase family protein [Nocardioidaceae bacterium]